MHIKNQTFKDEDTLLEMLFDFSLGNPSAYISSIVAEINEDLEKNEAYQSIRKTLTDEDDRVELYEEERDFRLSERLLASFDSFAVKDNKLFGLKEGADTLLYEIDLY